MPQTEHVEKHFESSLVVRDVVIGMADGLTVPFALAAGLSGAVDASTVIIIAGLAEVAAGSIAMGLGGYLAAKGDAEHYESERRREEMEIVERTDDERHEVLEILESYGLTKDQSQPILTAFEARHISSSPWSFSFSLKIGMNAAANAPSPGHKLSYGISTRGVSDVCCISWTSGIETSR